MPRNSRKLNSVYLILMLVLLYFILLNRRKKYDIRNDVLPVLVMACNRPYLKRCLESLVRYRPDNNSYPIIVSQDCRHEETRQIIQSFAYVDPTISFVEQPDQSDIPGHHVVAHLKGYYKIARHYRFALNHVFRTLQHKAVIIVEDDLEISPDFYEYFRGTYPLLYQDPTIWCVSAWNDNCKKELVEMTEKELLHRTDFFPGLGWMLLSKTWEELEPNWPETYFDDWLRDPAISRGRVCIRPEISRTFNFGRKSAKMFGLMDDLRHGVPRTGLRGVVQCFIKGRRVFLVPKTKSIVQI
ncbi:alpha-1,3-mannosyl-glycoprotein 2-beta-N-acetylglucosaminyltransferase-like [Cydia pomonella]|uniref:alpha-1,3-mannosyl-glycoprotein 2-beta-N-acetylglucosaminyltransferase-like n=1 Tax=Cydia pomonella TaxID=82600 RepID=UPI002ADD8C7C|nr:alpha-1,3-mannosyl-glycoprotein 2-beta-N-acetylglucosaminyltransferase-like [Cydia pomonella]